jgi:hypothetical protein
MSKTYDLDYKRTKKKAEDLKSFLLELDSIADKLYNRLEYDGVWETIMNIEDVRVKYYTEFYEYSKIIEIGEKRGR